MRCVFGSNVMVRAPRSVWTVSIVVYFPPTFFTIVSVPSPFELNARPVLGSAAWIPSRRCSIGSRFSDLFPIDASSACSQANWPRRRPLNTNRQKI